MEVGLQLSGGIDSSLITFLTNSITTNKSNFKTFSIIFDDLDFSEIDWIKLAIKNTNSTNLFGKIGSSDFVNSLKRVSYHLEHPINHPNTIGIYYLAKLSKENGIKVLLSGEGADELFSGYSRFLYIFLRNQSIFKFVIDNIKYFRNIFSLIINTKSKNIKDQIIESTSKNNDILLKKVFKTYSKTKALKSRINIFNNIKKNNYFKKHRKYEILTYLQSLLIRQDKMNMAFGVENRVPFLSKICLEASLTDQYIKFNIFYILKAIIFVIFHPKSIVEIFTKIP